MSRPRRPFGANPPGRLMATMIKVLAAEMSDQQRLARGKRYHADDAVIDIVVGHGAVTAEVQGGRPDPYVVTIEADGGSGVPRRSELWVSCSCPDDSGTGVELCKHAVAAMFALSDEVAVEPELVDRWRASRRRSARGDSGNDSADTEPSSGVIDLDDRRSPAEPEETSAETGAATGGGESSAVVIPLPSRSDEDADEPDHDSGWGPLAALLGSPTGAPPPEFPDVEPVGHGTLRDETIRRVLDDALDHLHLRWE